ncbi:hypothetical protein [Streptomyces sp. NPDC126514]|uniref:hypothetical protein n=1 Tax=Streptomyces sp. NPDC126514 TaxID=3155210 RepID=UPI00331C6FDB
MISSEFFTLAETEMLRNLNVEFRRNELPDELYSQLVRHGAVLHMKNACASGPGDVKIRTPQWAAEAAAGIGAGMAPGIGAPGVRVLGDPGILSAVPQASARTVHRTTSKELVRVLGHRAPKRLRRR